MRSLLLALVPIFVACGSSPQPVTTPASLAVAPNECATMKLESWWGARAPTPASNVTATVADPALAKAVVEGGVVYVFTSGTGATTLDLRYLDPATKKEEQRSVALDVRVPKASNTPYPLENKNQARCDELRTRLGVAKAQ